MKLYKSLLAAIALTVSASVLTGCDEDLAVPPLSIPKSDWKANTTIAELKAKYWSTQESYYTEIGTNEAGEHMIIGGRIIANDITGNIYKYVVLQDATGATIISVNMKDLHEKYKVGEEMFIDVTGLHAGMTSGLFEIGAPGSYTSSGQSMPQIGQMSEDTFLAHAQINGLPKPGLVDTITMTIPDLIAMKSDPVKIQQYQSQLIRLNEVSFQGGGSELWASRGTSHNTRYLFDEQGKSIAVDNSGMSNFNDLVLPAGHGDILAILNYYRGNWQLVFRTNEDCLDFGGESYAPETPESEGNGSAEQPYSVGAVISGKNADGSTITNTTDTWVTGYIVGWINGMSMADGATFTTPATSNSNILLAATPDEKNPGNCIPVALTSGSVVRTALNLKDNSTNLGKQVSIKGNLEKYFGTNGVKSTTLYAWGDKGDDSGTVTPDPTPDPTPGSGDGTATKPYEVDQVISGATGTGVWMTGYIVGAVNGKSISDAAFAPPFELSTNILIAANAGETDVTKCVPTQLPAGALREALNLVDNQANLGKQITIKGNLETYFGKPGMKSPSKYQWGSQGSAEDPADKMQFKKVTSITSGKQYLLVADGKMAKLNASNYGYLSVDNATDNGGIIEATADYTFTITTTTGGYTIKMSDGRYLYQTGSYNSFNFSATEVDGCVFTIEFQSDGTAKITNVAMNKYIQYSSQYTSYGCYATADGSLPTLYEKVN